MSLNVTRSTGGIELQYGTELPRSRPFGFESITPFSDRVEVVQWIKGSYETITFYLNQTIVINTVQFSGSGTSQQLATKLRDEVFFKAGGSASSTFSDAEIVSLKQIAAGYQ